MWTSGSQTLMFVYCRLRRQLNELSKGDSNVNAFMTDEKDWIDGECAIGMSI